jgi:hypothetical protein
MHAAGCAGGQRTGAEAMQRYDGQRKAQRQRATAPASSACGRTPARRLLQGHRSHRLSKQNRR